jgi:hypothetical protein
MPEPQNPEVLPPEAPPDSSAAPALASSFRQRAERLFSDRSIELFAHLLDDWFRVPFTPIRVGLDGIIGFIPGLGPVLAGLASFLIIVAAWVRGVPSVTLLRMMVNLALEVLIGAIPFFGDLFDIAWKANRRNVQLMQRHLRQPRRHTWKDYAFLLTLLSIVLLLLAVPIVVLVVIVLWLARHLG